MAELLSVQLRQYIAARQTAAADYVKSHVSSDEKTKYEPKPEAVKIYVEHHWVNPMYRPRSALEIFADCLRPVVSPSLFNYSPTTINLFTFNTNPAAKKAKPEKEEEEANKKKEEKVSHLALGIAVVAAAAFAYLFGGSYVDYTQQNAALKKTEALLERANQVQIEADFFKRCKAFIQSCKEIDQTNRSIARRSVFVSLGGLGSALSLAAGYFKNSPAYVTASKIGFVVTAVLWALFQGMKQAESKGLLKKYQDLIEPRQVTYDYIPSPVQEMGSLNNQGGPMKEPVIAASRTRIEKLPSEADHILSYLPSYAGVIDGQQNQVQQQPGQYVPLAEEGVYQPNADLSQVEGGQAYIPIYPQLYPKASP